MNLTNEMPEYGAEDRSRPNLRLVSERFILEGVTQEDTFIPSNDGGDGPQDFDEGGDGGGEPKLVITFSGKAYEEITAASSGLEMEKGDFVARAVALGISVSRLEREGWESLDFRESIQSTSWLGRMAVSLGLGKTKAVKLFFKDK